jgi:demethylmenaquinone methyltransferase / 2-methoxy-6-polyprenyl-1,4-benzoquinol methylase
MSVQVQRLFNGIAPRYDFLNHFLSAGRDRLWRKRAADCVQEGLAGADHAVNLLDLCGGTGDFLQAVLQRVGQRVGQKVGSLGLGQTRLGHCLIGDFAIDMLKRSQGKFAEPGPDRLGVDAMRTPFKPESFDAVFCGYGIRNLDDWRLGLNEVQRIMRPNGVFITLEFFRPETLFTRFFYGGLAPLAIPLFGGIMSRKEAYAYLVSSIRAFAPVSEYAAACKSAGFDRVQVLPCDFGITHIVVARKPAGRA